MAGLRTRHVAAAGTADVEALSVPTLAQDDQHAGNSLGHLDAENRLHIGLRFETPEEGPRRIQALRPSLRFRGLLE